MAPRRPVVLLVLALSVAAGALFAGCADGGSGPMRDASARDADGFDAGGGRVDAAIGDAGPPPDAMRGMAQTCEACAEHPDCESGWCAALTSGGSACLPRCNIDLPDCPARFECVANFTDTIPEPVCAPVGERCCVDPDGDAYGTGVGCFGLDCDETDVEIHEAASETCDGVDEDCDTRVDEGDPRILCPGGPHVAVTACASGMCGIAMCEPQWGDCNGDPSDGCETDIDTVAACGSCTTPCMLAHVAVQNCDRGACGIVTCEAGYGDCNGIASDGCEQPLTTTTHCGGCGMVCGLPNATSTCATGMCRIATCDRNWGNCDSNHANGCESPLITNVDCGACAVPCAPASGAGDCSTGMCRVTTCAAGYEDCNMSTADGCETSIRTTSNCGACGVPCTFPNAVASCAAGACTLMDCLPGFGNCDGITGNGCETMVNTVTSCGACGRACAPAHATGMCTAGTCGIASCDPGWSDCDGIASNGCETPITTTTDCGACGVPCARAGAVADCMTGMCRVSSCLPAFADCDMSDPNGCERSIRTLTDCGGCDVPCARTHASATCSTGMCAITSCDAGWANCDGVDPNGCETSLRSLMSCGSCGLPCARANATADCSTGTCRIDTCNPGWANCDGVDGNGCETSLTSLTNCGACGVPCALTNAGETCATGMCEITTCSAGYGDCDSLDATGCETSIRTLSDCGACGAICARAGATATCSSGTCGISSCDVGAGNCDGIDANGCEASLSSLAHCGSCGTVCDLANASESCATGTCALGTCAAGYGNCDGIGANGCETALTGLGHCGGCGVVCDLPNATETCATGSCRVATCAAGWDDCDGIASNGCETSLRTLTDCGSCGSTCSRAGATATCSSGTCAISSCNAGRGNCDGIDANGCETTLTSLTHCGACGATCDLPNASESCSSGTCALGTCASGYGNCDGNVANGCETALNTLANCGGCGTVCDLPGAGESCATGTCMISGCASGQGDCDMNAGNGCETTLNTLTNCGGCGTTCSLPNATESCSTGSCAIVSCAAGWGNCDGLAANGCETPLNTLANCMACGMSCDFPNASETCSSGTCTFGSCAMGYGNCDGMVGNGCETPLTSLTHCGGCGVSCALANASESCSTGVCTLGTCSSGYGNCDGAPANGCEAPLTTLANCGGCGVGCSRTNATATCSTGSCQIGSCSTGYANCDGQDANGCERSIRTTTDCNACGVACNPANATGTCSTGTCGIVSCASTYYDVDGSVANGCECQDNAAGATCGSAQNLGGVAAGGSATSTGVIPLATLSDWYTMSFPTAATGAPRVRLTTNPGTAFRFDVVGTCGGTSLSCESGGTSGLANGLTDWQFLDDPPATVGGMSRMTAWPTTVYVRVYRTTPGASCAAYTMTVTR